MKSETWNWFRQSGLAAAAIMFASCSPQGANPSELLTIDGMTVGVTNPIENISVRDYVDATKACRCGDDCKLYASAENPDAVIRLWPERGNDGSCRLMFYAMTRNEALAASAAGIQGAAFDLFHLSGEGVTTRYRAQPYATLFNLVITNFSRIALL